MHTYARVSARLMEILSEFTDLLEQVSIDEAFLDVSGSSRLFGSGREIAERIKGRIRETLGLTASVGVAGNKFLAKIASDLRKPDGLVVVEPGREKEFLEPLPVGRLWGVGPKTEAYLRSLGLERVGQLAALPEDNCIARMGATGRHLLELAQGKDDRPVFPEEGCRSIGHESTFDRDTADRQRIEKTLLDLAERVARRLRRGGVRARTIAVKFRESDFSTYSRRATLGMPADTTEAIYPVALGLMRSLFREGASVRLIGVHAGSLEAEDARTQMSFFDASRQKDRKLAAAMDTIVGRFGRSSITRAALVASRKLPRE